MPNVFTVCKLRAGIASKATEDDSSLVHGLTTTEYKWSLNNDSCTNVCDSVSVLYFTFIGIVFNVSVVYNDM